MQPAFLAGCGCLLLALYVLPLYFPPGPAGVPHIGPETGLWTRLFPHVPGWMALRLAALGAGTLLLAWAGRGASLVDGAAPAPAHEPSSPTPTTVWCERAALAVAALLCLISTRASGLSHWGQLLLVLALGLPALILRLADAQDSRAPGRSSSERLWWGAVVALVVVWVLWRMILAPHDARAADLVDMWKNFDFFLDAGTRPGSSVTHTYEVGVSSVYLLSIGLPFVSSGLAEPTVGWIQAFHSVWIALTAFAVAALARRIGGAPAMLPAVAALLFSPFMMSMAVCVAPFGLMTAIAAGLSLLVCRIYERPRRADVAALAALAGMSVSYPHLALYATASSLAVVPWLIRRRPPLVAWAAATLTGVAALIPVLSNLLNVSGMSEMYLERRGAALVLEQLILGQKFYTHREVAALWQSGIRGLLDVPIAALLQPFAILRSPVRLSGDVYFEPWGAGLAAVGIAACIGQLRHSRAARILCGAMALGILPAAASATDRASLTRNLVLPVLLPLFTVIGIRVAGAALHLRMTARLGPTLAMLMAASGVFLFDGVNPHIIPRTWLGLTLDALAGTPADEVLLFEHGNPRNDWLHVAEIARYLPPVPLRVRAYQDGGSLLAAADGDAPAAPLLLWSPSLEEQASVSRDVCTCWPQAALYTLRDTAELSRAVAADLRGAQWRPALPPDRWSSTPCPAGAAARPTCTTLRAMAHNSLGQQLVEQGKVADAVSEYREAVRLDPAYATAHISLGLAFAAQGNLEAAVAEYREALRISPDLAPAHNDLAIAMEDLGRPDEAITHYLEAVRIAPEDSRSRMNLGAVLARQGRVDEAIAQFRAVLELAPYMPEAHLYLGDALAHQGHAGEAMAEYRAALRDRPGWPPATDALAWALATADDPQLRDPREAVRLAKQAVEATQGNDARLLRTLAVAHAADGRGDEAAAVARRASAVARAAGQVDLARDIDERFEK